MTQAPPDETFELRIFTESITGQPLQGAIVTVRPDSTQPARTANHPVAAIQHQTQTDARGEASVRLIPSSAFIEPQPYVYRLVISHPDIVQSGGYRFEMPAQDTDASDAVLADLGKQATS